ncbi:MAG: Rpn family recombination-promoting nuclease/putative transposase [Planctomycetaceae bacterium]|jgi:predicted transposase YdaD|nr:Rpn family recombination-promoting nuclease/putative transposase [Planctomycetaceae bacterium]
MVKKSSIKPSNLSQPIDLQALNEFKKTYQHDAFCKNKLRNLQIARKFLQHVLKPETLEVLDLDRLQIDPETYIDEELKQFYLDVLYRIPIKNSNEMIVVFILIEIKTQNDKWTIFQVVKYVIRIWNREFKIVESAARKHGATEEDKKRYETFLLPMVLPIIFYYGKNQFTAPTELIELIRTLKGTEEYAVNMNALLCDVSELVSKEELPEDTKLSVLFMTLQTIFSQDVVTNLMKIYQKLQPTIHLEESQREWQEALFYATTSAKHFTHDDFTKLTKQTQKKGGIPMSMSLIDELVLEGIAKGEAKGIAKGIAEGEAKGIVKGEAEFGRNAVLSVLRKKFTRIPKKIETTIRRMNDPIALESLVIDAATCQTLHEFSETLR